MNAPVVPLMPTLPLVVEFGAVYVMASFSASAPLIEPVTTPVVEFGAPTVRFTTGAVFLPKMGTVTVLVIAAPLVSVIVTVNVSALSALVAAVSVAACRAAAEGV